MGKIPLPQPLFQRIWSEIYFYDAVLAFLTVPVGVIAAWKLMIDGYGWFWLIIPLAVLLVTAKKILLQAKKESGKERVQALDGCLHTLHATLANMDPKVIEPRIRLTLHCPSKDGQYLVQAMNYVGDQREKGTVGRKTRKNCGAIGKAFEENRIVVGSRETMDPEAYIRDLRERWHFTEEEARKRNASSMSWLAIPLTGSDGKVAAVLYADSVQPNFFSNGRVEQATLAAAGIAEFVSQKMG